MSHVRITNPGQYQGIPPLHEGDICSHITTHPIPAKEQPTKPIPEDKHILGMTASFILRDIHQPEHSQE